MTPRPRPPFCAQKGLPLALLLLLLLLIPLAALAEGGRTPDITLSGQADTPTPTPTAPKPSGPLLESLLTEYWWLPSSGNATPVAVYQPVGATSQAASYTDLSGNGYNITTGVEPTWTAPTGWVFSAASSHYLVSSGYTIPNDQTATVIIRYSDGATTGRGFLFGFAAEFGIQPYFDGASKFYRSRSVSQQQYTPIATSGIFATAGLANYFDGAFVGNHSVRPAGSDITSFAIGAQSATSPGNYLTGHVQAVAIYANTLDATDVFEISGNMAALADATATPTETPTPTNTPTATATSTPAGTPTPTSTPPGDYAIQLPSGQNAYIDLQLTEGDRLIGALLLAIAVLLVFGTVLDVSQKVRK